MTVQQKRFYFIDVFRAITMLLMIFVYDLWSLTGIPVWFGHARADQDFLGFSDIVFPCFLFIVGMAIPYAIRNRIAKGENHFRILSHILLRSVALLVMGFFTVNISDLNVEASGMSREAFQGFAFAGIAASLLLDCASNPEKRQKLPLLFIGSGVLLLIAGFVSRNYFICSNRLYMR